MRHGMNRSFQKFKCILWGPKRSNQPRSEHDGSPDSIWYCRARLQNEDGAPDAIWIIRTRHILMQLKEVLSYIFYFDWHEERCVRLAAHFTARAALVSKTQTSQRVQPAHKPLNENQMIVQKNIEIEILGGLFLETVKL